MVCLRRCLRKDLKLPRRYVAFNLLAMHDWKLIPLNRSMVTRLGLNPY